MASSQAVQLAKSNARSIAAQWLFLKTHIDITRPVQTYALLTTRCNCKCVMCDFWREQPRDELSTETWLRYLEQLRRLSGPVSVNFSGGEPLLRKDLIELLTKCREIGLAAGIVTNGLLLNSQNIAKLLAAEPFNINISIDSLRDELQDAMRGVPGSLAKVKRNIEDLMKALGETEGRTKVILKSIVSKDTLDGLTDLTRYAADVGMSGISFQPVFEFSDESKDMLRVEPALLEKVLSELIAMKTSGYPILNSEASMRQWPTYFAGEVAERRVPCVVALRDLFIYPNGDAIVCGTCNTVIGNIAREDIGSIWQSATARKLRRGLVNCSKLCLNTCVVKRSLKDYISLFSRLR